MQISPCGVIIFQGLAGTSGTLFFKSLQFFTVGIYKNTVSKIFSAKDENGDPAYKELHIMWEILGSKAQILKYGMTHLQNKQKNKR